MIPKESLEYIWTQACNKVKQEPNRVLIGDLLREVRALPKFKENKLLDVEVIQKLAESLIQVHEENPQLAALVGKIKDWKAFSSLGFMTRIRIRVAAEQLKPAHERGSAPIIREIFSYICDHVVRKVYISKEFRKELLKKENIIANATNQKEINDALIKISVEKGKNLSQLEKKINKWIENLGEAKTVRVLVEIAKQVEAFSPPQETSLTDTSVSTVDLPPLPPEIFLGSVSKKTNALTKMAFSFGEQFSLMASRGHKTTPQVLLNSGRTHIGQVAAVEKGPVVEKTTDAVSGMLGFKNIETTHLNTVWEDVLEKSTVVSKKLLYHVLGDPIGASDKELVGKNQILAWRECLDVFEKVATSIDTKHEFQQNLSACKESLILGIALHEKICGKGSLDTVGEELKEKISLLSPGESIVIPGGWSASPSGHSMVYEFVKGKDDESHELRVHNAGSGIEYHEQVKTEGKKQLSAYSLQGISVEKLCSVSFLTCLRELYTVREGISWNADDIYKVLLPVLGGKKGPSSACNIDIQLSGTCSFASVFAYMQTKLSPELFVRVRIGMGFHTLSNFKPKDERDVLLAIKCSRLLSQQILEAEREGILSLDELKAIRKKLAVIEQNLGIQKKEFVSTLLSSEKPKDKRELTCTIGVSSTAFQAFEIPVFKTVEEAVFPIVSGSFIQAENLDSQSKCLRYLHDVKEFVQQNVENKQYDKAQHTIELATKKILTALETHKEWDPLIQQDFEPVVSEIQLLSKMYVENVVRIAQSTQKPIELRPAMLTTIYSLIECTKILGKNIPEINSYPLENAWIEELLDGSGDGYEDKRVFFEDSYDEAKLRSLVKISPKERWGRKDNVATIHSSKTLFNNYSICDNFISSFNVKHEESLPPECPVNYDKNFLQLVSLVDGFGPPEKVILKKDPPLTSSWRSFRQIVDYIGVLGSFSGKIPKEGEVDLSVQWTCDTEDSVNVTLYKKIQGMPEMEGSSSDLMKSPLIRPYAEIKRVDQSNIGQKKRKEGDHAEAWKQELLIEATNPLQIDTALAVFSSYPDLLLRQKDQVLLEQVLFGYGALESVKKNKDLQSSFENIAQFVVKQLRASEDNIDLQVYCLRLARLALEKGIGAPLSREEVEACFSRVKERLDSDPSLTRQKFIFHSERAYFLQSKKDFSPQELDDFIISSAYAVHASEVEDPYRTYDLQTLLYTVLDREDVRIRLQQNGSSILNAVTSSSGTWKMVVYPVFSLEGSSPKEYHMDTGRLVEKKLSSIPTPSFLFSSIDLKRAFGGIPPAEVMQIRQNVFLFEKKGEDGSVTPFRFFEKDGIVQKKCGEHCWLQYVPKSQIMKEVIPEYLREEGVFWWDEEKTRFLIEMKNGSLYEAVPSGSDMTIFICDSVLKTRTEEKLIPSEKLPPYLQSFEDKGYILASTRDGTTVSHIRFPRIGDPSPLGFSFVEKVFRRDGSENEILVPDQSSSLLEGTHKLVLRDEKTKESHLLIPGHFLEKEKEASVTFSTVRLPKNMPKSEKPREYIPLYTYKKEKGDLIPESSEARAQLSYVLLAQQEYEKCAHVLESMERVPLSPETVQILLWIIQTEDTDVRALFLRLKAEACLKRQEILFHEKIAEHEKPNLSDFFLARHTAGMLQLSQEEELLLGIPEKEAIVERSRKSATEMGPVTINERETYSVQKEVGEVPSPLHPVLTESFWKIFDQIRKGTATGFFYKLDVKSMFGCATSSSEVLEIAARSKHSPGQAAAVILLAMKKNPERFKDIIVTDKEKVWKQLLHISNEIMSKEVFPPISQEIKEKITLPFVSLPQVISKDKIPSISYKNDPGKVDLSSVIQDLFVVEKKEVIVKKENGITTFLRNLSPLHRRECDRFDTMVQQYGTAQQQNSRLNKSALSNAISRIEEKEVAAKRSAKEKKHVLVSQVLINLR